MTDDGTLDTPLGVALARLAAADPDRPAITDAAGTITRRELERRTNQRARAYAELGVEPGSFVTIALPNGIEFYEAVIATWKLGATPQPLSNRLPRPEREAIIELVEPALVVGLERGDALGRPWSPAGLDPEGHADGPLAPAVAASFKAPTSGGSTGRPKVIVSTQPAVTGSVVPFGELIRIRRDGCQLITAPLFHNGPFLTSMCGLFLGNHVVVMPRFDAARALALVERHRVDWMYAVPTMMLRIWRLPEDEREVHDLSSLRTLFHLAAPCPPWLKEAWISWLGAERILELYAATEVQAVTVIAGDEWLTHRGSVGRAAIGEIEILGADGTALPAGEVGEVWLRRGPDTPAPYRYLGAEPKARPGRWETVGDLGHLDEEGYLYLADRDSDMILVGGANVYPAEVEAALEEHPAVISACVIGLPDEDLGAVPHALVQVQSPVDDDDLDAHVRARIAGYKVPRRYERVDEPLRDDAGKVRRSALRASRLAGS